MGVEIAARCERARELFESARNLLGYDLLALQRDGPEEKLRETEYSQPAIFTTNLALYAAIGDALEPVASAGHSFGEFCSLVAARSLTFEAALRIVDERGKAMQRAAQSARGGMSAVLGLQADAVRRIVDEVLERHQGRLQLANFNSLTQIVISGDLQLVQAAADLMLAAGAKRVVPLNVSGAWHSALMEPAVERFSAAVEGARFDLPAFDVISNVDAQPYRDVSSIRTNLIRSLVGEVRWHETAQRLLTYDLDLIVECGAGAVLAPLMRRMPAAPPVLAVSDAAGVEKLQTAIREGVPAGA
jgi:[acyl-carrier-protein] S-malonyltransferase